MAKRVLGRGLGAYFPDMKESDSAKEAPLNSPSSRERVNAVLEIKTKDIEVNPHQPRKDFDEETLRELSASIAKYGLIQPVTVRYLPGDTRRVELISGERRLRAARMAGLETLPAFVREANDEQMIIFGIIENIQREQLNPVEVAFGYQRLMEECGLTQQEVAGKVGRNRTTITNTLRLLQLPAPIQQGLKSGLISAGHARALVSLSEENRQEECYQKAVENQLSVRELEQLVQLLGRPPAGRKRAPASPKQEWFPEIARELEQRFSAGVKIQQKKKGGEIKLSFGSKEELKRFLAVFDKSTDANAEKT